MANYLLHNLGYENPVNFRYVVLSTIKGWGICAHLRDELMDQLSLTNVNDWLGSTEEYERAILRAEMKLRNTQAQLKKIQGGDESYIKELYDKEVNKAKSLLACNNSYNKDEADKVARSADQFKRYLTAWESLGSSTDVYSHITEALQDIYSTALQDEAEYLEHDKEAVAEMRRISIPTYEEVKSSTIEDLNRWVKHWKEDIKDSRRAIKRIQADNEIIRDIFKRLDEVEVLCEATEE